MARACFRFYGDETIAYYTAHAHEVDMEDKEADSGGETEAGTIQRDVVRAGVVDGELCAEGVLNATKHNKNYIKMLNVVGGH